MITRLWRGVIVLAVLLLLGNPRTGEAEMAGGTGSTLIINPVGLSSLTMDLTGGGPAAGTTPYLVPLQTLDLNEGDRWRYVYSDAPPGEGGEMVGQYGPLVPLSFWVILRSATRGGLITAYNDLARALMNAKGGTVQYKPEDAPGAARDTYYHYVTSPPPELVKREGNRWDAPAVSNGMFTLVVGVEFQTQPVATSDPANPVALAELSVTLQNWYDAGESQENRVEVSASNLKGSMPALLRLLVRPGSDQSMGRLIVFRRSEGAFATFINILEAEGASTIYPSVAWTDITDTDRGGDHYMRCLPPEDANGTAQGLRFTIPHPDDYEGRFAVLGICYDDGGLSGGNPIWTHQVMLKVGNVVQEGKDTYYALSYQSWQVIYAGEFELPVVDLSDVETAYHEGPYLEWYATRDSGASEFRLDAVALVYVADSDLAPTALDVPCEDEDGVTNSELMLIENYPGDGGILEERAHVLAQADNDFKRGLMTAQRGSFLALDPKLDHLLVFLQERWNGSILEDDFESYKSSRWMPIGDFESDETWTGGAADTANECEGSQGWETDLGDETAYRDFGSLAAPGLDLEVEGRFQDDDYVVGVVYFHGSPEGGNEYTVEFCSTADVDSWRDGTDSLGQGWYFFKHKKSTMEEFGSPDWASIFRVYVRSNTGARPNPGVNATFDWLRLEKADPDNATVPNATGSQWDFQPNTGEWAITEDISGAGATLACLDTETDVEKAALIDETTPADVKYRAKVMAKRDTGFAGIIWRAGDDTLTEGAEDCYVALLDIAGDQVEVGEYEAGVYDGSSSPAFVCAVDTWYTIGVIAKGTNHRVYATASSNLSDEDDVFDAGYLVAEFADGTFTSGKCGVMGYNTLIRADEVKLVSLQDKVVPADEITLQGWALFRTIAPFME